MAVDTTWFISIRARELGHDTQRLADSLEFGVVITRRGRDDDPAATDGLSFRIVDSATFTRAEFETRLRSRVRHGEQSPAAARFAVLYTHGYGTSLHEAWEHTLHARLRSRGDQPWVVFCWPSVGAGVAWPSRGAIFTSAYRTDVESAAASRGGFSRALGTMIEAVGGSELLLLSHSMGVRVVGEALASDSVLRLSLRSEPLRAVAFVAPDIDAARFGDSLVPAMRPLTRRLLLYASSNDNVLAFAQRINDTERAGLIRDAQRGPLVRSGLESIDMTDGERADGRLRRFVGPRHTVTRATAALFDLIHVVGAGHPSGCRVRLGTARETGTGAWRLTAVPLPSIQATAQCNRSVDTPDQRRSFAGNIIATTP